jgi:annexin A7/11
LKGRPTVTAVPNFNASADAAVLRKAMKGENWIFNTFFQFYSHLKPTGFGTDEDGLISVICHRSNSQLVEIAKAFKTAYGKDLLDDVRSETSKNFEKLLIALLTPRVQYYCEELKRAMAGLGTDEKALIEVMCTMTNREIRQINDLYQRLYGHRLEDDLRSDTSGSMKRLMTSLSAGNRDESMRTDINEARADAQALKAAGVDRWGTDESEFNRILCSRNYEQLKLICREYEKLTGNTLEKDIKKEFSGDIEDALLAVLRAAENRPAYFASCLYKSMKGLGTNDSQLIRVCVTRCEVDMMDIKDEFQKLYGKSLKSFISGDTSGE